MTADEIKALVEQLREYAGFDGQKLLAADALEILTLENQRLRVDAQNWRDFAEHQTWCQACAESVSLCSTGSDLQAIAMQHSDKEKP